MDYESNMRLALAQAAAAAAEEEVPVGCVITDGEGRVIGVGHNRREATRCVTGHAEIEALESACIARGDWRLDDCTAFVTLEPGAIINARIPTVVYGAREPRFGSAASILNLFEERYPSHTAILGGVLAEESEAMMRTFFESRRGES